MAVRIALEMRRNFQLSFKKRRRQVERAVARSTRLFTAFRQNIISRTEETMSKWYNRRANTVIRKLHSEMWSNWLAIYWNLEMAVVLVTFFTMITTGCLHWKIYQMIKSLRLFTTKNFVDCLDLIAEVYISQFWHPQLRPVLIYFAFHDTKNLPF